MPNREQKLQDAVKKLIKYHGLTDLGDLARFDALLENFNDRQSLERMQNAETNTNQSDPLIARIVQLFIDTADGAYVAATLATKLNTELGLTGAGPNDGNTQSANGDLNSIRERYKTIFYIGYDTDACNSLPKDVGRELINPIKTVLGGEIGTINSNPNNPTKEIPGLSVIFSNTKRIAQTQRYANACCIFLNGIPNLELAKAVPFLNIEFQFSRPPLTGNGQLQAPGLLKFLFGATQVEENSSFKLMAMANSTLVSSSNENGEISSNIYSVGGMEMFTSPQTLLNANEIDDRNIRSNLVLDKFRPLATLKQFEVGIAPSIGLFSFKTAKLQFILHDKSRLAEIADFIRPDLYGNTQMLIEYGWIHPDGENNVNNVYGDLINGMRVKELYGIRNASYSFDDSGQVLIDLDLFTKGSSDLTTEIISSNETGVANNIRQIRELQETISDIRQRLFPENAHIREVRGIQILDAAQDALSNQILSRDVLQSLKQLRQAAQRSNNHDFNQLLTNLNNLIGADSLNSNRNERVTAQGLVGEVRQSIITGIRNKINNFNNTPDPFLTEEYLNGHPNPHGRTIRGRAVADLRTPEERNAQRTYLNNFDVGVEAGRKISLAKLLLSFIGIPLASTKKFDDIQFIFYPFNAYAGYASKLNIGEFEVDLSYFTQELARYRLGNIAQSANMTLRDFLSFITQTLIDDPAARSYGMWDEKGPFQRDIIEIQGNLGGDRQTAYIDEVPDLLRRQSALFHNITPDGTFKMPKVDFFIECLPEKQTSSADMASNGKTILKIHIFDTLSSAYESVGSILASAQNAKITSIGEYRNDATTAVNRENRLEATTFINKAISSGLLSQIPNSNPPTYEIVGGARKLKEFVYKTVPYIIHGSAGNLIKVANLSSIQNAELATVNMLRSFRKSTLQPNGELPGGLPMRIIPSELQLSTHGCPLINFAQQFFVDFSTGTTVDNIYAAVGISHRITDGEFTTDIRMIPPTDAYGVYESFSNQVFNALQSLQELQQRANQDIPQSTPNNRTNPNSNTR